MRCYGTIEAMRSNPPPYSDPFITQWEIPNPKDDRTRMYAIFDGIHEYMSMHARGRFNTCHEVLVSATYDPDDDIQGHPAFDIDMHPDEISVPNDWPSILETLIHQTISKQYPCFDDSISYVWMESKHAHKISRHLVLGNICFSSWRIQMKILVKDIAGPGAAEWVRKGIDAAIMRRCGSLRLPLNRKATPGSPLMVFLDPKHTFLDGIIQVHNETIYTIKNAHLLRVCDLLPEYRDQDDHIGSNMVAMQASHTTLESEDEDEMVTAFHALDQRYHTGLDTASISGAYLQLRRKVPGVCPISLKQHEHDNAVIFRKDTRIFYACHRGCTICIEGRTRKYIDITPYDALHKQDILARII